jgi:hypothetical protein
VSEELLDLCKDALPNGGRTPRVGRVVKAGEVSGTIRLEPGTDNVLIAVEAPGNLQNTPALDIEYNVVTAFSELRPGSASLL